MKKNPLLVFILSFLGLGCDGNISVTETIYLETDSYISSSNSDNHSLSTVLKISKTATSEERIILKFPTGSRDQDTNMGDCLTTYPCNVFFLPVAIVTSLLNIVGTCVDEIKSNPDNLDWAILKLNTTDGSTPNTDLINLDSLNKPWWHTVSWDYAHPFSNEGLWTSQGGDINSNINLLNKTAGMETTEVCDSDTICFNITDYFKTVVTQTSPTHYGLLLSAADTTLTQIPIHSVQAKTSFTPRIVAKYTGTCFTTSSEKGSTHYLGNELY